MDAEIKNISVPTNREEAFATLSSIQQLLNQRTTWLTEVTQIIQFRMTHGQIGRDRRRPAPNRPSWMNAPPEQKNTRTARILRKRSKIMDEISCLNDKTIQCMELITQTEEKKDGD